MGAGTPQGAVLSPILFNIFVDDIKEVLGDRIVFAQYADDLVIWVRDICPRRAESILNERLALLSDWTNNWRIRLAPEKSVAVVFSRRPTQRRLTVNLKLMGETIERHEDHKFLGVTFDDKLLWGKHINNIIGGTSSRIQALKKLSAKSTFKNPTNILRLHESLVNSILKYGSIAYAGMSEAMWERVKTCHARCVKAYVGLPNYVSYELVCDTLGIKQIKDEIFQFAMKRIISMISFSPLKEKLIKRSSRQSAIYRTPSEAILNDNEIHAILG